MEVDTNPAGEVEAADTEAETVVESLPDQVEAEEETSETSEQEEFDELEEDGEKYSVPKKLKSKVEEYKAGYMKSADYTNKTKSLAEERKAFEADRGKLMQHIEGVAELKMMDKKLDEFRKLNWDEITNNDPVEAFKLQRQFETLRDARSIKESELSKEARESALKQQQTFAKLEEEGRATLAREIKGWSSELEQGLKAKGIEYGFSKEEMETMHVNPKAVKVLHKAYLYDQLMKQKAQAPKPAPEKPVTLVKSGKSSSVPTEYSPSMSDAQFDKWYERAFTKKKN